jgi:hypothetical protein
MTSPANLDGDNPSDQATRPVADAESPEHQTHDSVTAPLNDSNSDNANQSSADTAPSQEAATSNVAGVNPPWVSFNYRRDMQDPGSSGPNRDPPGYDPSTRESSSAGLNRIIEEEKAAPRLPLPHLLPPLESGRHPLPSGRASHSSLPSGRTSQSGQSNAQVDTAEGEGQDEIKKTDDVGRQEQTKGEE